MWLYGLAIWFAFIVMPSVARAEQTVNELLKDYNSAKGDKRSIIELLVSQTENGMNWANIHVQVVRNEKPLYCDPENLVLTGSQILDMLRREAKEFPETGRHPYGYGILAVKIKTFPCPQTKISN